MRTDSQVIRTLFNHWRQQASFARYDRWCEEHAEDLAEQKYAEENNMEPEYWCWNCRFSDCEMH